MAFCVRGFCSFVEIFNKKKWERILRTQVGRFYSCFLCPPLKYTLFLRGKSNKICKEMWKKEELKQFTGYMLFKLKDFFIGETMSDERANERVEKSERKRELYH